MVEGENDSDREENDRLITKMRGEELEESEQEPKRQEMDETRDKDKVSPLWGRGFYASLRGSASQELLLMSLSGNQLASEVLHVPLMI